MTASEGWLASQWPFVRAMLPPAPASVLEIGCGPLGGFVPALRRAGYDAVGIDPAAPQGVAYRQIEFEDYRPPERVDALVACTSLHHVADLGPTVDRFVEVLVAGGAVAVVEWAWERFDDQSADWCFARLGEPTGDAESGWLQRCREEWLASGLSWQSYFRGWAAAERLHPGDRIVEELDARVARRALSYGPYLFADLAETSEADEQAAIDAGQIHATRIRYAGVVR